jgi:hypothetical protein
MHYVTSRFHQMQKHKFDVTCPSALFMETPLGPTEHEKWCLNVSRPRCTRVQHVTHRSNWMQKQKFSVMCPDVLFMKTTPGSPEHEK